MDTNNPKKHPIFSVLGIEIEYMVVDKINLNINPIVDKLFEEISGSISNEVICDTVALNNELALHVLELKTNGPTANIETAQADFDNHLNAIHRYLDKFNARLMPTGMHPWLVPSEGMKLWPHGEKAIYETYNKIFDCRGHGWSNLQSVHLNMPFQNEEEFVQLHNAIRIILPIIPAICSSTPICESKKMGYQNMRMMHYMANQRKIPNITGHVIPEFVIGFEDYYQNILHPMYQAIKPYDPAGILQEEWLNSRGAIARFDRNAVEIRIMDTQECNLADFAAVAVISGMIRYIVEKTDAYMTKPISNESLKEILLNMLQSGMSTEVNYKQWIEQLALPKSQYKSAKHVMNDLIEASISYIPQSYHSVLAFWLSHDNLAQRMLKSLSSNFSQEELKALYQKLCDCLATNELFLP